MTEWPLQKIMSSSISEYQIHFQRIIVYMKKDEFWEFGRLFLGPMYGLRLLLNVNQRDYLPTTEAAGVRLVVHEQV